MESTKDLILSLVSSFRRYVGYQQKYIKLDMTEKLTLLLTALVLGCVIFVIGIIALIFLALAATHLLEAWTGSLSLSYFIVAICFVLLCMAIYFMRKLLIVDPLTKFFARLLLDKTNDYGDEDTI